MAFDESLAPGLVEAEKRRNEDGWLQLIVELAKARERLPADTEAEKMVNHFMHIVAEEIRKGT